MNKTIINVDMVKEMEMKTHNLCEFWASFKGSDLHKSIKRGNVEPEVYSYVYNKSYYSSWDIRKEIIKNCNFSFQDACRYGMAKELNCNGEWKSIFEYKKENCYFGSVDEFLEFTMTEYGIDLTSDHPLMLVESGDTITHYLKALFVMPLGDKLSQEERDTIRQVYIGMLPYLFKVKKFLTVFKNKLDLLLKFIKNVWCIDLSTIKSLIEKLKIAEKDQPIVYMTVFHKAIDGMRQDVPYIANKDTIIFELIPIIKKLLGEDFNCGVIRDYDYEDFFESLLKIGSIVYGNIISLTRSQKDFLFTSIIEPTIKSCPFRTYPLNNYYIAAALSLAPGNKLNETFITLLDNYSATIVLNGLIELCESDEDMDVTEFITDYMIGRGYDWERLIIPKEKAYDVEYLKTVCKKIHDGRGYKGILFGIRWGENWFGLKQLDVTKLPVEFFIAFKENVNWNNLSRSSSLSLNFMKVHFDKIHFESISSKCEQLIDDELAEALIKKYGDNAFRYFGHSKNLSVQFVAKNIMFLWSRNSYRNVTATGGEFKLTELLAAI